MMDFARLKSWFIANQRELPWRLCRDPYSVWVSEMMLQQTQVSVVIPYYYRWMKRFPTIKSLAEASGEEVIKLWEGLGYYSRARYLHSGARFIVENYKGVFPEDPIEMKKIKGLGPYTMGAIRSFAFHQKVPAVDGNVLRVLARYFLIEEDIAKTKTKKAIEQMVEEFLPDEESWMINEALIELGALVCKRSNPDCNDCPLRHTCKAFATGAENRLPLKTGQTKTIFLSRVVPVVRWKDYLLVRKCQEGEIMSDLHEFPYFPLEEEYVREIFQKQMTSYLNCQVECVKEMDEISHSFTRYRVKLKPVLCVCKGIPKSIPDTFKWLTMEQLNHLAFSSGHRRILQACNLKMIS